MLKYPDIEPVAISIGPFELFGRVFGPFEIYWYALSYIVGVLIGWWLLSRRAARGQVTWQIEEGHTASRDVEDIVFYTALGVVLGGRMGSMLFYNVDSFLADPVQLLRVWEGGMSFHGGLLGVLLAMWLYARSRGHTFFQMTDFIAPVVPVGLGFGRIGNFINGELWGKQTTVAWGMEFEGVVRHPSMLYQGLFEGLILFVILWVYSAKPRPTKAVSGLFLLLYGIFRFAVEFVRLPDSHIGYLAGNWLTMGQVLSAPMIIFGIWLLMSAYKNSLSPVGAKA